MLLPMHKLGMVHEPMVVGVNESGAQCAAAYSASELVDFPERTLGMIWHGLHHRRPVRLKHV